MLSEVLLSAFGYIMRTYVISSARMRAHVGRIDCPSATLVPTMNPCDQIPSSSGLVWVYEMFEFH